MKCLRVFGAINATSFNRGIQTGNVFLMRIKSRGKIPRRINYEPGLRHKQAAMGEDFEFSENIEDDEDFDENLDVSNIEKAYDMDKLDQKEERKKIGRVITAKKFFRSPPQPMTLTCNERECIRYLHKSDPLQWNVEALSESFPATPEAIKKVLRGKFRLDPERKQKYDQKVQRNWELLAEGKLKAEPEVLEHLKKFVNRKEVLLEQIKNHKFYLPEPKEELVWNQGEMSGILAHYEKAVQVLVEEQRTRGLLTDGSKKESKSSLEHVHEKIDRFRSTRNMEGKETFTLGGMIRTYSKPVTLAELEGKLLLKAHGEKRLDITEKAILESFMGVKTQSNCTKPQSEKSPSESLSPEKTNRRGYVKMETVSSSKRNLRDAHQDKKKLEKLMVNEEKKQIIFPDNNTQFLPSRELGKFLNEVKNDVKKVTKKCEEEEDSDPEKVKKEEEYFAAEVQDVENTPFWGGGRTSEEKALMESRKTSLGGPDLFGRGNFFNGDVYPEKIKIPKDKKGSGLTFKVKDCFYDDDGEFLYRVPGMVK